MSVMFYNAVTIPHSIVLGDICADSNFSNNNIQNLSLSRWV